MKIAGMIVMVAALLFLACDDTTTINNYNMGTTGMIYGAIDPIEIGTIVWLDEFEWYRVPEDGYFIFTEVAPGEHLITIEPVGLSPRRLPNVTVWPAQATQLGTVVLSDLPYPIYRTVPSDGDSLVYTSTSSLALYLDEPLSLDDLDARTTITPPLAGRWSGKPSTGRVGARYQYTLDDAQKGDYYTLRTSTSYTVTIDGSVRTAEGVPLGSDAVFTFQSEPLMARASVSAKSRDGLVSTINFQIVLSFNDSVDVDSVTKAAVFDPPIPGIWIRRDSRGELLYLAPSPSLLPSTEYTLIVSNDVPLSGSTTLRVPDTTVFTTTGLGVESISPCNGCTSTSSYIYVSFSTPMDTASANSAFTVSPVGGEPATGTRIWSNGDRILRFYASPDLGPTDVYVIRITTSARSQSGVALEHEVVSYFVVQ